MDFIFFFGSNTSLTSPPSTDFSPFRLLEVLWMELALATEVELAGLDLTAMNRLMALVRPSLLMTREPENSVTTF